MAAEILRLSPDNRNVYYDGLEPEDRDALQELFGNLRSFRPASELLDEARRCIEKADAPHGSVAVTGKALELMIKSFFPELKRTLGKMLYQLKKQRRSSEKVGQVSDELVEHLKNLAVRNAGAHFISSRPEISLTEAKQFLDHAQKLLKYEEEQAGVIFWHLQVIDQTQMRNQSIEPSGGSRFCQPAFVEPVATASRGSCSPLADRTRLRVLVLGVLALAGLVADLYYQCATSLPPLSVGQTGKLRFRLESDGSTTVIVPAAVTNNSGSTLFCTVAATTEPITNVYLFCSQHIGFRLGPKSGTISEIEYCTGSRPWFLASAYRRVVTSPTESKVWPLLDKLGMQPKNGSSWRLLHKFGIEPFRPRVGPICQMVPR